MHFNQISKCLILLLAESGVAAKDGLRHAGCVKPSADTFQVLPKWLAGYFLNHINKSSGKEANFDTGPRE